MQKFILFLFLCWLSACPGGSLPGRENTKKLTQQPIKADGSRLIIGFSAGCDDDEMKADLIHSLQTGPDFNIANGLTVQLDGKVKQCGYLLREKGRERFFEGVMTDVDLTLAVCDFFKIESPFR